MNMELTPRQKECAWLAANGNRNREIGTSLGIKEQVVKNCLGVVYMKLGISGHAAGRSKLRAKLLEMRRQNANPEGQRNPGTHKHA